jgi:hypothetical protein
MTFIFALLLLGQNPILFIQEGSPAPFAGYLLPELQADGIFRLKLELDQCKLELSHQVKSFDNEASLCKGKLSLGETKANDLEKDILNLRNELARTKRDKFNLKEPFFSKSNILSFTIGGITVSAVGLLLIYAAKH